jgi:hypothetical protein
LVEWQFEREGQEIWISSTAQRATIAMERGGRELKAMDESSDGDVGGGG